MYQCHAFLSQIAMNCFVTRIVVLVRGSAKGTAEDHSISEYSTIQYNTRHLYISHLRHTHHSRFCHQLSFVPGLRSTFLIFASPLATLTFALRLTVVTIALPDVVATSFFTALPFATFVTAVTILEETLLGFVWSDDAAGSFLAPVHVKRRVRMSEQRIKLQEIDGLVLVEIPCLLASHSFLCKR